MGPFFCGFEMMWSDYKFHQLLIKPQSHQSFVLTLANTLNTNNNKKIDHPRTSFTPPIKID